MVDLDLDRQFFSQFALQGRFGRLISFHLAAGQLPQTRQAFSRRALGAKEALLLIVNGRSDHQHQAGHRIRLRWCCIQYLMSDNRH